MTDKCRIGVIGTGQRGCGYIRMALSTPGVELAALCDTHAGRMRDFAVRLDCSEEVPQYTDVETMLAECPMDAVVITVPDFRHAEVAVAALRSDKHIMLEKPMAPTVEECRRILAEIKPGGPFVQLGFVMREHPLYRKIRELVMSGKLGQVMSMAAEENLGVMHGASYMRRWHRKVSNSGGFVLAKCSHDLDLLSWIAGSPVLKVSSFGGCDFFRPEKQRAGYCSQCDDRKCRFRFQGEMVVMSDQEKDSPSENGFDLCVYNSDKDVVDNQLTMLEYSNGIRASFALNLFAPQAGRSLKIIGSDAYLTADTVSNLIEITSSNGGDKEVYDCRPTNGSGHGGSDQLFFDEFVHCIRSGERPKCDYRAGLAATVVGNAIEQARVTGQSVQINPEDYL